MITNLVLRLLDMAFAAARWVEELNDELNQSGQFHRWNERSRPVQLHGEAAERAEAILARRGVRPASIQTIRTDEHD